MSKVEKQFLAKHCFDPSVKCDHVTNNINESLNSWVDEMRGKPILALIDGIRVKLMTKLHTTLQKGRSWNSGVPPTII